MKLKGRKNEVGITLVALVVTIIVLIILAGVTINSVLGDNGIITKALEATKMVEIADEESNVKLSALAAAIDGKGVIREESLKSKLDAHIGSGKYTLTSSEDSFIITYNESKRSYTIDKTVNNEKVNDTTPGDITDGGNLEGDELHPYEMSSVEDYVAFITETRDNEYVDKYIVLTRNIDFYDENSYVNPDTTEFGDYNRDGVTEGLLKEISNPNGRGLENGYKFYGTFDGNGYCLNNFYMNDELGAHDENGDYDGYIGIFQKNYGTIKNLTVKGNIVVTLTEDTEYTMIGCIAGENESTGQIINCNSDVEFTITAENINTISTYTSTIRCGGIVGQSEGTIDKCIYEGGIGVDVVVNAETKSVTLQIGGIVGKNEATLINCINRADINCKYDFYTTTDISDYGIMIAGIAGGNDEEGILENCINVGKITSTSETGIIKVTGIIADSEDANTCIITNVYNEGELIGSTVDTLYIGGILGKGYGNINYLYNIGGITVIGTPETEGIGAIIGDYKSSATNTTIQNCYYNKIDGIYGAEGRDIENINAVTDLTRNQVIEYMNTNVTTNNSSSSRVWYEFEIIDGKIEFK